MGTASATPCGVASGAGATASGTFLGPPTFTLHPVAAGKSSIGSITRGPDGALWFLSGTGVVTIDAAGSMTAAAPQFNVSGGEVTSGPDGALWFMDPNTGSIGRLSTCGEVIEYAVPKYISSYRFGDASGHITSGPDGALWFTEPMGNRIVRMTTAGTFTEFLLPTSHGMAPGGYYVDPTSIAPGSDGAMWFVESAPSPAGNRIGRMTISGELTEFPLPTSNALPWQLISGQNSDLWFTELGVNQLGRITTSGSVTEYKVSSDPGVGPAPLVQEPDGTIWFGESRIAGGANLAGNNQLGRLTPDGKIVLFPIPTQTGIPGWMALATDGSIWITHSSGSLIQAIVKS